MSDLSALLEPVSDDAPCGDDLSFSSEFDAIQDARREDDPSLDQGEWVTAIKVADWKTADTLCRELLAKRSKDIRLGVWLVEAQCKLNGAAGLAAGLNTLSALIDQYWDGLHPLPEDGDHEQRIGNLAWLATRLVELANQIPLTGAPAKLYSYNDIEAARVLQGLIDHDPDHAAELSEGRVTQAEINKARQKTPTAAQLALLQQLEDVRTALSELERAVDARLSNEGPSFAHAREALATLVNTVGIMARDNGATLAGDAASAAQAADASGDAGAGSAVAVAHGPINSRQQALQQLRQVADFFRRTEPHSPVAYLADRAARWGEMPLHQWLRHVIKDQAAVGQLEELLGVEPPPAASDDAE